MNNNVIYDKLEDMQSAIEYNGGGITSLLDKSFVKNVQRGTVERNMALPNEQKIVSLTVEDITKAVLLCYGGSAEAEVVTYLAQDGIYVKKSSSSTINLRFSWQVVEYL